MRHNATGSRQACTEKLQVLQDEIRRLRCEAERLEVQIQRLDIPLAPHNKLPFEILLRIFELCCDKPAQIPAQNGIYTISHVCSLWRQIALSTPGFWANISIKFTGKDTLRLLEILGWYWLSRAGNHPSSLKFMATGFQWPVSPRELGEYLLGLVIRNPCRELRLSLPRTPLDLTGFLNGRFLDYLEVLDIHARPHTVERQWPKFIASTTTPLTKLLHVRLVGVRDCQNLMTIIPWNQLQFLTLLLWIPYSHCLDILSECASLVRCRIYVDDSPVATSSTRRLVTLPALRVLRLFFRDAIHGNDGSHVEKIIRFLSVPRLCHLTLVHTSASNMGTTNRNNLLCELSHRSNGMPDLGSLDLGLRSSIPIDMRALLTNMPRLRLLHVRSGVFEEKVRNDIATGTLAPQLRSIMTEVRHDAIDILRMVELRHRNASMTLIENTKQVAEFSRIVFFCHSSTLLDSQQFAVFTERLASLKKAAPRLSIDLRFE
ncbi:hypothetical protein JOM56_012692 [Amanita muscaria]